MTKLLAILGVLVLSASTQAFAHGSVAHQAAEAVAAASKLFSTSQPKEVTKQFFSVNAENVAWEQFKVTITLTDKTTRFEYDCNENENVDPVVWECQ